MGNMHALTRSNFVSELLERRTTRGYSPNIRSGGNFFVHLRVSWEVRARKYFVEEFLCIPVGFKSNCNGRDLLVFAS